MPSNIVATSYGCFSRSARLMPRSCHVRRVSTDVAPPIPARWDNGGGYPCDRCPRPVHHEESTNDRCQHRSDRCPPCPVHPPRSEERRVGKECRCQWATSH